MASTTLWGPAKFMSAIHIGMKSKPSLGGSGAKPLPDFGPSIATAWVPVRSSILSKS